MSDQKSYLKAIRQSRPSTRQVNFELNQPGFEEVWHKAKLYANNHGFTVASVVIEALSQFLDREVES